MGNNHKKTQKKISADFLSVYEQKKNESDNTNINKSNINKIKNIDDKNDDNNKESDKNNDVQNTADKINDSEKALSKQNIVKKEERLNEKEEESKKDIIKEDKEKENKKEELTQDNKDDNKEKEQVILKEEEKIKQELEKEKFEEEIVRKNQFSFERDFESSLKNSAYSKLDDLERNNITEPKEEKRESKIYLDFSSSLATIISIKEENKYYDSNELQFPNCILEHTTGGCEFFQDKIPKYSPGKVVYPVEKGVLKDAELLQIFIDYTIIKRFWNMSSIYSGILVTEPPICKRIDRERIAEFLFEYYAFKKVFIIKPAVLTLLGEGKSTGIVAELNQDISHFVPIFDCYALNHAKILSEINRKDVLDYMKGLLLKDYSFLKNYEQSEIEKIVKESCYVALNYDDELDNVNKYEYKLPDGTNIFIKEPRIQAPEILVNTKSKYTEYNNIIHHINKSISMCDQDIRKELYNNIILTGINSQFKGLDQRVYKEITKKLNDSEKDWVQVSYGEHKTYDNIKLFFSNPAFEDMWITRKEYYEHGSDIIHRKSF